MLEPSATSGAGAPRGRAAGFGDWLPGGAEVRRGTVDACLGAFASWGYGLLDTPLVEPLTTIAAGVGSRQQAQLFRFMDADGSLLALVGERTVSVARVVATQLRDGPFPLRLCYAGPVLRNQVLLGGRRREALQAGCELIGAAGVAADAECVALAAQALARIGLEGVQIDVGHADFLPGLLEGAGLDREARARVLAALAARDLVAVEAALEHTAVGAAERDLLLRFPTLRGGRDILDAARAGLGAARPLAVLEQLAELWDLLMAHGLDGTVHLDLGAVRDWDYYTGPIFELFSGDLGFPLGSGGRYDSLLARFGTPRPATGFVLHVDRCVEALARRGRAAATMRRIRVAHLDGARAQAIATSARLRAQVAHTPGCAVIEDLEPSSAPPDSADVVVRGTEPTIWRIDGEWTTGSDDECIARLAAQVAR